MKSINSNSVRGFHLNIPMIFHKDEEKCQKMFKAISHETAQEHLPDGHTSATFD